MNALFLIFCGLVLTVFQTVHPPFCLPLFCRYDILVPYIMFCAFFRPPGQGLVAALFLGAAADAFSGGPFGVHVSVYFWLFVIAFRLPRVLKVQRVFVWCLASAGGVLIQGLVFWALSWASAQQAPEFLPMAQGLSESVLGAAASGWIVMGITRKACGKWDAWVRRSGARGEPYPAKRME